MAAYVTAIPATNGVTSAQSSVADKGSGIPAAGDPNEAYKHTQSQIYSLQETIMDSAKKSRQTPKSISPENSASPDAASYVSAPKPEMDSQPILQHTRDKYMHAPKLIGEINYKSEGAGAFIRYVENNETAHMPHPKQLPFPYNFAEQYTPNCFLPLFGRNEINNLVKIKIDPVEITKFLTGASKRTYNREIWGADIYTDDSDPLLALQHVGFFEKVFVKGANAGEKQSPKRTPGNYANPDNVIGGPYISPDTRLEVTIILLDKLQSYAGINRYGVNSRSWLGPAAHDGLSFGIYEIKVIQPTEQIDISGWKT